MLNHFYKFWACEKKEEVRITRILGLANYDNYRMYNGSRADGKRKPCGISGCIVEVSSYSVVSC